MDFFKKKSTVRLITGLDLFMTTIILLISTYKIVESVLLRLSPEPNEKPISNMIMTQHICLWFGLFALHVVPACAAFGLYCITKKGREELIVMIAKCRVWLKSTLYLLVSIFIMFILFALDSDVQSYLGSGICAIEFTVRVICRCFVQTFYESLH